MGLINVVCQSCKATMGVLEEWAGQKGRCPRCGTEYIMPRAGAQDLGEYRYDAFISYRHVKPDSAWAKWLHGAIETYRAPKSLTPDKDPAPVIRRVFREAEEPPPSSDAPLSKEIELTLEQSRFLIIICSPRTPQSEWVNKEAEYFRKLGRGNRILALLIEGEPHESFPRALKEIRRAVTGEAGITREEIERIEPLAADVRRSRGESESHLKETARLRMLASILGCPPDFLRQAEAEGRRQRRRVLARSAAATAAVVVLAVVGMALYSWIGGAVRARREQQRIAAQRREETPPQPTPAPPAETPAELAAREAERARVEAERARLRVEKASAAKARATAYASAIAGAYSAYREGDSARLEQALGAAPADMRGWEWLWLRGRLEASILAIQARTAVTCLELSGDGRKLAMGFEDCVRIWDIPGKKEQTVLRAEGATRGAFAAFSPDGRSIAVTWRERGAAVYSIETGEVILTLPTGGADVETVAYSTDAANIVGAGRLSPTGPVAVDAWIAETGKAARGFATREMPKGYHNIPRRGVRGTVGMFWVGEDGRAIVNGSGDERSRTLGIPPYSGAKGEVKFQHPDARIGYIALSGDMKTGVTGGEPNGMLRIWDGETGKSTGAVMGHALEVVRVAMSADGGTIASVDTSWRVKVWRTSMCVQPAVAGRTETVKAATVRRARPAGDNGAGAEPAKVVAVSGDGKKELAYAQAGPNGAYAYAIVNAADKKVATTLEGAEEIGERRKYDLSDAAAFSPDGKYVAAFVSETTGKTETGQQRALRVWDAEDGTASPSFAAGATGMGWSADGKRIATVNRDAQVTIWDPPSGIELMRLSAPPEFAAGIAFSTDRRRLEASGVSTGGKVAAWDVGEGRKTPVVEVGP